MSSKLDILLLGATGFTGRLVTKYLLQHPQRSAFTFGIAARSKAKLDELVKELELDDSIHLVEVDVTNFEILEEAVRRAKVVINTVGPFWRWGTPVVRACTRNGVHYVDITGETHWIREIILQFDYFATKTGSIIIPSCGLDSMPSDISAYLSNKALKEISPTSGIGESTTGLELAGGISGGTLATVVTTFEEVPSQKLKIASIDHSCSPVQGLPSPGPRITYTLPHSSLTGGYFFMSGMNKALVQRTWGLYELEALRTSLYTNASYPAANQKFQRLRYGNKFVYDEFVVTKTVTMAIAISLGTALVALYLTILSPLRALMKKFAPQPGTGPSQEAMEKGFIFATNVSSSIPTDDSPSIHVTSAVRGRGDPGYLLTSVMVTEAALSILLSHSDLPALGRQGGVLTPMSALGDVLIERLKGSQRFEFEYGKVGEVSTEGRKSR